MLPLFSFLREDKTISSKEALVNEQIRAKEVRLIDAEGNQVGIVSIQEAMEAAHEAGLDLINISPNAAPPVCRIADYGKYRYEQAKAERESKAKRKVQELREVKLKPKVGDHDFDVKAKTVQRLIQDGDRVKVSLRFKGREVVHTDLAIKLLERLFEIVKDDAVITQKPILDGRQMVMVLAPKV